MPLEAVFRATVWLYEGKAAWHFATLPKNLSARIRALKSGSVRVTAALGGTRWKTSIFPDTKAGAYLLPIKASVREKERVRPGEEVEIALVIDVSP